MQVFHFAAFTTLVVFVMVVASTMLWDSQVGKGPLADTDSVWVDAGSVLENVYHGEQRMKVMKTVSDSEDKWTSLLEVQHADESHDKSRDGKLTTSSRELERPLISLTLPANTMLALKPAPFPQAQPEAELSHQQVSNERKSVLKGEVRLPTEALPIRKANPVSMPAEDAATPVSVSSSSSLLAITGATKIPTIAADENTVGLFVPNLVQRLPDDHYVKQVFRNQTWPHPSGCKILHTSSRVKNRKPGDVNLNQGVILSVSFPHHIPEKLQGYWEEANRTVDRMWKHNMNVVGVALILDFEDPTFEYDDRFDYVIFNRFGDELASVTEGKNGGFLNKITNMMCTPFDTTIFVDGDTRFCASPNRMMRYMQQAGADVFANLETRNPAPITGLHAINSGVIGFKKNAVTSSFFFEVMTPFVDRLSRAGDQLYFQRALNNYKRRQWKYHVLPHNFHYMRCSDGRQCIIEGDAILFHGRIFSSFEGETCNKANENKGPRIIYFDGRVELRTKEEMVERNIFNMTV